MKPQGQPSERSGFDAAVGKRGEDHLNRWPFATEIAAIAMNGPDAWSVRVGIYGEWGTGKTSVLKFISTIAEQEDHIVVWFDPWEYSSKVELWQSFVLKVFNSLEEKLGGIPAAGDARRKSWVKKAAGVVKSIGGPIASVANERAGNAVISGLDLVRKHLSFGPEDLKSLRNVLGKRRVIILIDDLDRTAAELVPEILFALKELMNIPAFSFVCAFDPVVVGKVLRQHHRGFGDGLKFLEKIIDYPRWLPPPSSEGLLDLALAEAKGSCEFVPLQAIRDAVPLLPPNPRAIRQFIRLLALLRPQISRHHDHELRWPVIIAANVLKVRHPRIAYALLQDNAFWRRVEGVTIISKEEDEKTQLQAAISDHVESKATANGVTLAAIERTEISTALARLCAKVSLWSGGGAQTLAYQMFLAEAPHAVTWKEFEQLLAVWAGGKSPQAFGKWTTKHSKNVEQPSVRIYREVISAALNRYSELLRKSSNTRIEQERVPILEQARSVVAMIEHILLKIEAPEQSETWLGEDELALLIKTFANIVSSTSPGFEEFIQRNETMLMDLIRQWSGDIAPLAEAIGPGFRSTEFDGPLALELQKRLIAAVSSKLASQILAAFREQDFIQRLWKKDNRSFQIRGILVSADGPLWGDLRKNALELLNDASTIPVIQENAYELLLWFSEVAKEPNSGMENEHIKALFSGPAIIAAIWKAATIRPLSLYGTAHLNRVLKRMAKIGMKVELPKWWSANLKSIAHQSAPQVSEIDSK